MVGTLWYISTDIIHLNFKGLLSFEAGTLLLRNKEAKAWANRGSMLSSAIHQLCDVGGCSQPL